MKTFTSPEDAISSVFNYCIDCAKSQQTEITTLQTDNDRLSLERINALKVCTCGSLKNNKQHGISHLLTWIQYLFQDHAIFSLFS